MADQEHDPEEPQEDQEGQSFVEVEATTSADKVPNGEEVANQDGRVEGTFNFAVGGSLQEDIEMFGEDIVREFWLRSAVIKGQSAIRRELESGTHPDDIAEQLADWRPDVQHTASKDPKASVMQNFQKLPKDEKEQLLAQLREQAGE